jgi:hypothetical protein
MAGWTVWFSGVAVMAGQRGSDGGDGREDDVVPGHGDYGQVAWTQWWRRPSRRRGSRARRRRHWRRSGRLRRGPDGVGGVRGGSSVDSAAMKRAWEILAA